MKRTLFAVTTLLLFPALADAGGLFNPGYGSQAQPRAGAFVAKADDPTALFHNPAGLALQDGTVLHLGFNFVNFSSEFQRAGGYEDTEQDYDWDGTPYPKVSDQSSPALGLGGFQAIPLLAVSTNLGLDIPLRFGAGLVAANGYPNRDYEGDYLFEDPNRPPPPTRYDLIRQESVAVFPTIAAAYSINPTLHVGLSLSGGLFEAKARTHVWAITNYEESVGLDSQVNLDVTDSFIPGFGAGVLWHATPNIQVGANYRSQRNIRATGTASSTLGSGLPALGGVQEQVMPTDNADCPGTGTIVALNACINTALPQQARIGARYIVRDGTRELADIEFDVQWEDWSAGDNLEVIVAGRSSTLGRDLETSLVRHGFRDTFSFRLGGAYNLNVGDNELAVRGGVAYDTAAAPTSWTRLAKDGLERVTVGAGVSYSFGRYRFELGGGAVIEPERTVGVCNPDIMNPGCETPGMDTPFNDRNGPDPGQPLRGTRISIQSPFNAGTYNQGYINFSLGMTASF